MASPRWLLRPDPAAPGSSCRSRRLPAFRTTRSRGIVSAGRLRGLSPPTSPECRAIVADRAPPVPSMGSAPLRGLDATVGTCGLPLARSRSRFRRSRIRGSDTPPEGVCPVLSLAFRERSADLLGVFDVKELLTTWGRGLSRGVGRSRLLGRAPCVPSRAGLLFCLCLSVLASLPSWDLD
jgi:hypothetical protein